MKSAIYIEQGITQFVLTPESDIDKQVLAQLQKANGLSTYRGSFYECRGGWIRHKMPESWCWYGSETSDNSLIFIVRESKEPESVVQP